MKLLVAAITFGVTIGGLFLFGTTETQKKSENTENYAQIVQNLQNQNPTEAPTPKSTSKSGKTATKTPTPSVVPSFSTTLPILSPTPSELQNRGSSISQPNPSDLGEIGTTPSLIPSTSSISTPSPTATAIPTESIQPTPTPQTAQQNNQTMVISLTSPVKQNDTAQLDIKTAPQARCAIKVTLPSGKQSTASGLEDKTADSSGVITWSWKINWNTKPGTAVIEINCTKDSQSFSKILQMEIIER